MAKKLKGACKALMSLKEAKFEDDGNGFDQLPDGILVHNMPAVRRGAWKAVSYKASRKHKARQHTICRGGLSLLDNGCGTKGGFPKI
jgi:hypothetical protein